MMRRLALLLGLLLCLVPVADAQIIETLAPTAIQHFDNNNGAPCSGCKLFTYAAGTTTKLSTFTSATGGTANTNPIILNARGEAPIWMPPTTGYKFVLAPANDTDPPTNPFWTSDQIFSQPRQCGGTPVTGNLVSWGAGPCLSDSGVAAQAQRTVLAANLTLYVDPSLGTDSATCGTATGASACRTIAQAVTNAYRNYDTKQRNITIQLADSLVGYTSGVTISGQLNGGGALVIKGNTGSPSNVVIDGGGAANCFLAQSYANVQIQDLKVQNCVVLIGSENAYTVVNVSNVIFGACSGSGGAQMSAARFGYMEAIAAYQISASTNCAWHIQTSHHGNFRAALANTGGTVGSVTANLAYASGFARALSLGDITFLGYSSSPYNLGAFTVTGTRWYIDSGGIIQTLVASATFFPGDVTGILHGDGSFNAPLHIGTTMTGGGAAPTFTGDDYNGYVVEDAGSVGVVLTFGGGASGTFDRVPTCTVSYLTAVTTPTYAVTQTTLTTAHAAGAPAFVYKCNGG